MPLAERKSFPTWSERALPLNAHIGACVQRLRIREGLSPENLAAELGVAAGDIDRIERGEQRLTSPQLARLAESFGVTIASFFEDAGTSRPETFVQPVRPAAPSARRSGMDHPAFREESMDLLRDYYRITDPAVRRRVVDLIRSLAKGTER